MINWRMFLLIIIFIPQIISAQFYFFGRNKVHYDKFEWKVLKTEHFNIYYYDDFSELAEIGAKYAEDSFDSLKIKFNHYVTNKIPLIFYNTHLHFQQTNTTPSFIPEGVGGFFEFMKGRVVIPYLGSLAQFKHVIRHELVHVFMTSKIFNVLTDHRIDSGRLPPLWFTEGLAEYWSTHWDTQAEMIMRDLIINGNFVRLEDLDAVYGFIIYKEGQNFLQFVSENYGEDKILLLMENFWRFNKFKDILEYTIGEKFETIDDKWFHSLKRKYFPLYKDKYPHFINAKKLTDEGFNFDPAYYEFDGKKEIYFIGNYNGYTSVFKMNYNPGSDEYEEPTVVIEGEREAEFESFHLLENTMDVSSNGNIAFVTKSLATDVIHIYSTKEEKIIETIRFDGVIRIKSPSFSKDADKLVFTGSDSKGFIDIYAYDFNSDVLTRLTNDYYEEIDPIFNKDNSSIIFASDRTTGIYRQYYNLFEYKFDDHSINYLTYINANTSTPKFSPDFSHIYFTCDHDSTYNIWRIPYGNNAPESMTQVTKFLTSVYGFSFVDSTTIVTSAFENFSFQFYNLNIDNISTEENVFVKYDFEGTSKAWKESSISIEAETDRLNYEKTYQLDYAAGQLVTDPVYGSRGGALFSLSDMLGDDRYLFYFYNSAEVQSEILKNFNVAISRVSLKERSNYGFGIFNYAGRRYDIRESDEYFYERVYGGYFALYYPFSSFQRLEIETSAANSDKELIGDLITRKSLLLTNTISFVHDNSIWAFTGPIDGSRLRILLGYTSDVKYSNVNYYSFIFDYRYYYRLSLRSAVALRGALFVNHGKEARRYFAGGSWDLRGWPRWSVRGEKLWLSSVELRFPLIDRIAVNFPFFGLSFFNLRGALFMDAGSAWDTNYRQTIGSVGFGFRLNLFNIIALRYDMGKKIEKNFSSFQPKLFYQFFFGWDF